MIGLASKSIPRPILKTAVDPKRRIKEKPENDGIVQKPSQTSQVS